MNFRNVPPHLHDREEGFTSDYYQSEEYFEAALSLSTRRGSRRSACGSVVKGVRTS